MKYFLMAAVLALNVMFVGCKSDCCCEKCECVCSCDCEDCICNKVKDKNVSK